MLEEFMNAMVSNPTPMPRANAARGPSTALHPELLLASDGSPAAAAATRVVSLLASRWSVSPHVVTVVPPPSMAVDPVGINVAYGPALEEELAREVRSQLGATCSGTPVWSHEMSVGSPANEIVRIAAQRASDLIVLGLRPHAFLDRVFRDETALSVMRHATVPVLAVTPLLEELPRRIAVAID